VNYPAQGKLTVAMISIIAQPINIAQILKAGLTNFRHAVRHFLAQYIFLTYR
jgi:hypothetical protein